MPVGAPRSIGANAIAKLDAAPAEVFAELLQFLISRRPVLLDWPLCAAPCNELLVVLDDLSGIGARLSASRVQIIMARELGSDVDRQPITHNVG